MKIQLYLLFALFGIFCLNSCSDSDFDAVKENEISASQLRHIDSDFYLDINQMKIRDPFIVAHPESKLYYMYYNGGGRVRAYSSPDLANWRDAGDVFVPPADFWANSDFWAPDVYLYNNKYYMFLTLSNDGVDRGTSILVADEPMGPFSPVANRPATPTGQMCLDASFFVDEHQKPWILYSHEWLEVIDGKILAQRLSDDLSTVIGDPIELFKATDAPWVAPLYAHGITGYVTDAPYIYRTDDNELIMLWASFDGDGKYAIGQAYSQSGTIMGPWVHEPYPLNNDDGGHSMVFKDFHGKLKIAYHAPNSLVETPVIRDIYTRNGKMYFNEETYISEEFDRPIIGSSCGEFLFRNYDLSNASWSYSIDDSQQLSGDNSLHFNIENSGTEFWALQMRAVNLKVKQGNKYAIKFKVKANKDISFEFRSEGLISHVQSISVNANQPKEVEFELPAASSSGNTTFFFALGNSGNNYDLWLDAIEIVPVEPNYVQETLLSERFDQLSENRVGSIFLNNYDDNSSNWSFHIDNTNLLLEGNSLCLNIGNTGSDFWTLQARTDNMPISTDKKYYVSFVAKSDKDVSIEFRSEGPLNHIEKVHLQANKISHVNIELNSPSFSAPGVMFFALGNTGKDYRLWLDALKIESKY